MAAPLTGQQSPGTVDRSSMPTYNTIMSVAVGAGLLAVVLFFIDDWKPTQNDSDGKDDCRLTLSTDGSAIGFGVLGAI